MSNTYYTLVDRYGTIKLSRFTTDPNHPLKNEDGMRLLKDNIPQYTPELEYVTRVEPVLNTQDEITYKINKKYTNNTNNVYDIFNLLTEDENYKLKILVEDLKNLTEQQLYLVYLLTLQISYTDTANIYTKQILKLLWDEKILSTERYTYLLNENTQP